MGSGELGELPPGSRGDRPASPERRKPGSDSQEHAQSRRAPAETQTREDYGESIRSRGDPIPASTGREARAGPADDGKRPVERPPRDEPGERDRNEPRGSDSQGGDREGRRADPVSEPAQERLAPAENLPKEADAESGLSPGDPDQAKAALSEDRGTDGHPLWHFHADFRGTHTDWYMDQDGHFTSGPDAQPTAGETGDAAPGERAGDLIANLEDARDSRADRLTRELCEHADHIGDVTQDAIDDLTEVSSRPASSAHAAVDSRPTVSHLTHGETDTGTAVTGVILIATLMIRAFRQGLESFRQRKDEIGDKHRAGDRAPGLADQELR